MNFTDVSADDWFYGELQLAMGAGYVGGFEDGTFRPNDTVTRAQAAAFIAKAKNLANDPAAAARFVDNSAIADWAKGAVGAAAKAGYIGGYQDGTFQPDKALTRAEAVSMLDRVLSQTDKAKDDKNLLLAAVAAHPPAAVLQVVETAAAAVTAAVVTAVILS